MPAPPAAPGKPKDPTQQRLRAHKRQWNAAYKDFTQKLKAFKNGINGKGDTKFSLPPSDIKFPLPNEIGSFLDGLASEFQSMVSDAQSIVQEQDHYSQVRRKRKPKAAPVTPEIPSAPAAPAPDSVVETLSRLGAKHEEMLEVYASNRFTRLWQYMKAPFSGQPFNKQRVSLLSLSADLYHQILDFENEILSLKIGSIPTSLAKFQAARYTFDSIKSTLVRLIEMMEPKEGKKQNKQQGASSTEVKPKPAPPPQPTTPDNDIKAIEKNIHLVFDLGLASQEITHINNLIQEYRQEIDEQAKSMYRDRIRQEYRNMMKSISNEVQKMFGPVAKNSPQGLIDLIIKNRGLPNKPEKKDAGLEATFTKEAHNRLTRYLKRQLVKARSYNKTAGPRLEVVDILQETKKLLKQFMDYLEKGIDSESLEQYLNVLNDNMKAIGGPLSVLVTLYEQEFYKQERKKKPKGKRDEYSSDVDQFTDFLFKRKIRRDLQRGLL